LLFSLQIIIDEPEDAQEFYEEDIHIDADYLSTGRDSEIPSRLSFIVKEKLHEFAKDLRRRTSQVKEDVIRDLTPEATEDLSDTGSNRIIENASLMSLIGLHEQTDDLLDEVEEGQFLPKYIDPFSELFRNAIITNYFRQDLHVLALFHSRCFPLQRVCNPASKQLSLPDRRECSLLDALRLHFRFYLFDGFAVC
jgi:hypothetical protein